MVATRSPTWFRTHGLPHAREGSSLEAEHGRRTVTLKCVSSVHPTTARCERCQRAHAHSGRRRTSRRDAFRRLARPFHNDEVSSASFVTDLLSEKKETSECTPSIHPRT